MRLNEKLRCRMYGIKTPSLHSSPVPPIPPAPRSGPIWICVRSCVRAPVLRALLGVLAMDSAAAAAEPRNKEKPRKGAGLGGEDDSLERFVIVTFNFFYCAFCVPITKIVCYFGLLEILYFAVWIFCIVNYNSV